MHPLGDHDIVKFYSDNKYKNDIRTIKEAPRQFLPEKHSEFFKSYPDSDTSVKYPEEISPDWLYFLEDAQFKIFWDIVMRVETTKAKFSPIFIVGGPGTGKTCILLALLRIFADTEHRIGIVLSDNLCEYVEASTQANISKYRVSLDDTFNLDLLLVDDPTHDEILKALGLAGTNTAKVVVMAFDPLQLDTAITDDEYDEIVRDNGVKTHKLNMCYRQKANVGKITKNIIDIVAISSPFADKAKIRWFRKDHKNLTDLANDLVFINPHGYTRDYDNPSIDEIRSEVKRIQKAPMWQHWPSVLILLDGCQLPEVVRDVFRVIPKKDRKELLLEKVEEVKGLEFQHVLIFMRKECHDELQTGFLATGRRVYNQRRLLRIPFSRAKDSVVTFAIQVYEEDDEE